MNAQPPPPPPPPPPQQPGGRPPAQAIPAYQGVSDDSPGGGGDAKAGTGLRVLAGIGFVILLFVAIVMVAVYVEIGGARLCSDPITDPSQVGDDCYNDTSSTRTIALVLGWPGAVLLGAAAIMSLLFTIRGRGGRPLLYVLGGGIVLVGLSLIIG